MEIESSLNWIFSHQMQIHLDQLMRTLLWTMEIFGKINIVKILNHNWKEWKLMEWIESNFHFQNDLNMLRVIATLNW